MSCEPCDTEDEYNCLKYTTRSYQNSEGPPLIKKTSRLIAAVVQNQFEIFEDLLDSPKWYNVCDNKGYSLLQIAIVARRKKIFDYMLSIPDFPLEFENHDGQTAFVLALDLSHEYNMSEYYPYELMKKGACINKICKYELPPLHCAIEHSYTKLCKLLIEAGVDVNVPDCRGRTPLELVFDHLSRYINPSFDDIIFALLAHGAIPSMDLFEKSVLDKMDQGIQENLFLFLCDECTTSLELDIMVLFELIKAKSNIIDEMVKYPIKINKTDKRFFDTLCSMNSDCLKLTLDKFNDCVCQAFSLWEAESKTNCIFCSLEFVSLENLDLMLESNVKLHVIDFFIKWNDLINLVNEWMLSDPKNYIIAVEFCCYLLSHGLITIRSVDLSWFFSNAPRDFFKFLLYMDVQLQPQTYYNLNIMSILSSDVTMNMDTVLQNRSYHSKDNVGELVKYFVHPKLKEIYQLKYSGHEKQDLPELPTLVELARNSFRKCFIKRFNITSCKHFCYFLDRVLISPVHKKIITYETELY